MMRPLLRHVKDIAGRKLLQFPKWVHAAGSSNARAGRREISAAGGRAGRRFDTRPPLRGSYQQASLNAETLFALHRQSVFRYLNRVVGRAETAHDLTQEVFLRVARADVPDADASGHRAWVFRIARNLVLNHLRDGRRHGQSVELADVHAVQTATQEMGVAIRQALASLADIDRDVFLLRESAGLSYDEISAACDLTVEAVRGRLRRAREQLRDALSQEMSAARRGAVSTRSHWKDAGDDQ